MYKILIVFILTCKISYSQIEILPNNILKEYSITNIVIPGPLLLKNMYDEIQNQFDNSQILTIETKSVNSDLKTILKSLITMDTIKDEIRYTKFNFNDNLIMKDICVIHNNCIEKIFCSIDSISGRNISQETILFFYDNKLLVQCVKMDNNYDTTLIINCKYQNSKISSIMEISKTDNTYYSYQYRNDSIFVFNNYNLSTIYITNNNNRIVQILENPNEYFSGYPKDYTTISYDHKDVVIVSQYVSDEICSTSTYLFKDNNLISKVIMRAYLTGSSFLNYNIHHFEYNEKSLLKMKHAINRTCYPFEFNEDSNDYLTTFTYKFR